MEQQGIYTKGNQDLFEYNGVQGMWEHDWTFEYY